MAWNFTMIRLVRTLIDDLDAVQDYTDARLKMLLITAAQFVQNEVDFSVTYTIDILNQTLTPDPTLTASRDDAFTNLTVLKAACIIDQGTFRSKIAVAGLKAKAGPAALETMDHLKGFSQLLAVGPCSAYQSMRDDYMFGGGNICRAVLSPFVGNDFDPDSLSLGGSSERYM